ncbi:MAG: bacillithiol system redox-active protein YtxJ [Blastocatellia bacterium]|nr:bacillithiol system redox-active protein YtxJ [Blastocatellia bacterium]
MSVARPEVSAFEVEGDLKELKNVEELDQALAESDERPVLLFKHSATCPISARAFREFKSHLEAALPGVTYNLITVQSARRVSDEIEARLRVRHESPQAILVRNGRQVWNASHFSITAESLEEAIRAASDVLETADS